MGKTVSFVKNSICISVCYPSNRLSVFFDNIAEDLVVFYFGSKCSSARVTSDVKVVKECKCDLMFLYRTHYIVITLF